MPKKSKINLSWLYWLWVVILILSLTFLLFITTEENMIKLNNINPAWCNKYEYYLNHEVSSGCLKRCWENYGCEHNATGSYNQCVCTGGPLKIRPYIKNTAKDKYKKIKEHIKNSNISRWNYND